MSLIGPILPAFPGALHGPMPAGTGAPGEVPAEGGAWNPTFLSGCRLWLRADLGITLNGSNVSAWANQMAGFTHDAVQATAAKQPAYSATSMNGRPGITGDGVDDCLRVATMVYGGVAKLTVACVVKDTEAGTKVFLDTGTDDTDQGWAFVVNNGANNITIRVKSTINDADFADNLMTARRLIVHLDRTIVGGVGVAESAAWKDGVSQALSVSGTGNNAGNFGDTGALQLLARNNGASLASACTLGEVVIYNRLLSTTEIAQLDLYMKAFWGL